MERHVAEREVAIVYSRKFREYGLEVLDGGSSIQRIYFCPWCGQKLPYSLRREWSERIEKLGLDPCGAHIPPEMQSDAWWKDRKQRGDLATSTSSQEWADGDVHTAPEPPATWPAMTPSEFKARWEAETESSIDRPLVVFPPAAVKGVEIPEEAKRFLLEAGLPADAPPFLSFEAPEAGPILTLDRVYGCLDAEFRRYRYIGFNGYGNPICIDEEADGVLVCLIHDDSFRRILMNRSVQQLAATLLFLRRFIREMNDAEAEGEPKDDSHIQSLVKWIRHVLRQIDGEAFEEGCYWREELQNVIVSYGA